MSAESPLAHSPSLSGDTLFQNAFEHAAIGMALVAPDGKWLRVNRSICEITGYTEEELLQRSFQDITHPDDLDLDLANANKMLAGEIDNYQMEKRYFHKNGAIVWILLSVSLVRDDNGQPRFFIGQIQDITSRKESERQLSEASAEIENFGRACLRFAPGQSGLKSTAGGSQSMSFSAIISISNSPTACRWKGPASSRRNSEVAAETLLACALRLIITNCLSRK
jgi:PAS domain S-box-containing protein